jgi:hypothetical protein
MLQTDVFLQVALDEELAGTKSARKRERDTDRKTVTTNKHIDKHEYNSMLQTDVFLQVALGEELPGTK